MFSVEHHLVFKGYVKWSIILRLFISTCNFLKQLKCQTARGTGIDVQKLVSYDISYFERKKNSVICLQAKIVG